ncbi:MAG TPA: hypothetical protein VJV04_03445 [Nitrospiraceae bacterium]|nr:hypothetical protein [Nitrospiraceae bacterium]
MRSGFDGESNIERGKAVNVLPIIALAIFMMACGTPSWDHPKGMAEFEHDHQRCAQLAGQQAMDMDPHTGTTVEQAVDDCLQKKGYVQLRERR